VRDRFGDSGVTGLAILALPDGPGADAEIDTFLLSCRVLGRRVEDALLAFLTGRAAERGAGRVVAARIPTERNGLTATFYDERGFTAADGEAAGLPAGATRYTLDLGDGVLPLPEEMTIKVRTSAESHS
jgi:predicted enzyme involved in methoxymalonyl-ACP biosynthesis